MKVKRVHVRNCEECNRPRIALKSGAGYVCPMSHGQIVQAEPEQAAMEFAGLPFDDPKEDASLLGRFETSDGGQWSIRIP